MYIIFRILAKQEANEIAIKQNLASHAWNQLNKTMQWSETYIETIKMLQIFHIIEKIYCVINLNSWSC